VDVPVDAVVIDRWFPARWGALLWWSTGVAFVVLGVAVARGTTTSLDTTVTKAAVANRTAALTHLAMAVSWCGLAAVLAIWAGGLAIGLDRRYRSSWRCTVSVLLVLLLDVVVVAAIKHLVDRPRPPLDLRRVTVSTRSFPSGHATATTAAVTMLLICLFALSSSRRLKTLALLAGLLLVAAMGWSRVYLGVHYLSDVVAGTLLGCWLALTTTWLLDARRLASRGMRPYPPSGISRSADH
jgi:undecaprenyl-diphosphatase